MQWTNIVRSAGFVVAAVAIAVGSPVDAAGPGKSIETYGNFETMGVIADLPANCNHDQVGQVKCYLQKGGNWRRVHDLVRVGKKDWYATSLFFLRPSMDYRIKVEFLDRAGKLIFAGRQSGRTRKDISLPKPSATIFVSPSGKDTSAGTLDAPLRTLSSALAKAEPGTTVYLRKGVYHEGGLTFARSGTAEAPIVVRRYGAERAILDASVPSMVAAANWADEGGGIYKHPYKGKCFSASIEHKRTGKWTRLCPVKTSQRDNRRTGVHRVQIAEAIYCDGTTAHITLPGPIADYDIHVARQTRAFVLENRHHIYFDGLEIRGYGKGDYSCAAFLGNSSNILFQNCRIYHNNTGIWLKGACFNNTVQDCEFFDDVARWPWKMVKSGGSETGVETGFVYTDARYTGRGLVIRRNKAWGLFDGVHLTPWTRIDVRTSETDFYRNTFRDIADDFIEADGFSRNVRIFDNFMDRSLSGISLAQALDGPTFIMYNVIANSGICQGTREEGWEGYPFKTNGGSGAKIGSGPIFFYHNTSYTTDPAGRAILIKTARWKKITFRNNIWVGQAKGFVSWRDKISPIDWDYDNLYVVSGAPLRHFGYKKGKSYHTLDDIRRELGHMKHGISADPEFVNSTKGDYKLSAQSPCIDKGVVIPGINDGRFKGKAPDIGAFER